MTPFNQNGIRKASRYYYWSRVSETTVPDLTIAAEYIAVPSTSHTHPAYSLQHFNQSLPITWAEHKLSKVAFEKEDYADGNFLPLLFGTIRVLQLSNPLPLES